MSAKVLQRYIRLYSEFQPDYLLLTKLDEADSHAACLGAAIEAEQAAFVFHHGAKHPGRHPAGQRGAVARQSLRPARGGNLGGVTDNGIQRTHKFGLLHVLPALEAEERERLILDHLSNVRWIAMRIHERISGAVSLDDLVSAGTIGLINAVDSYDPKFNVKLKTYAEYRIRGAILDSIRGLDGVPAHKRKRLKEIETAIAAAEQRLQRVPSEEEIAVELRVSLAEYQVESGGAARASAWEAWTK